MSREITAVPLTAEAFAPFGDVLDTTRGPDFLINAGLCERHHDRAKLDFGGPDSGGRPALSLFDAVPRALPYRFDLVERHPLGSQAFVPMCLCSFLAIVAPDAGGTPGDPLAFLTAPGQAINFHRGTWHGVLTPLEAPGLFAVVDRVGDGDNLEEHRYAEDWVVVG
ncbi:MAG: ureidoglycolate lyase [Maritimibacter sp.]|nr:ureidoglycolate lyase [Maritimibacter sp.]